MTELLSVKPPEDVRKKIIWLAKDYPYLFETLLEIDRKVSREGWNYSELCKMFGEEAVTAYSDAFFVQGRSLKELKAATRNQPRGRYTPSSLRNIGGKIK